MVNDQAINWAKAKVCVYADSVLRVGRMEHGPGAAERRWKGQVPRIFDIVYSSRDPERLGGEEHPTRELRGPDCISNAERVRTYAMKFLPGHWTFLVPGTEERWYGDSHHQKGQWEHTANKMVQRFKETGHLIFKSTSALDRGILRPRRGRIPFTSMEILWIRNS